MLSDPFGVLILNGLFGHEIGAMLLLTVAAT